jgi:hypothetical protein
MRYTSTGGDYNVFMVNYPSQSLVNEIVLDYGGSVKIHAKPTDTAESIIEELEKLLVIYIIKRDNRDG